MSTSLLPPPWAAARICQLITARFPLAVPQGQAGKTGARRASRQCGPSSMAEKEKPRRTRRRGIPLFRGRGGRRRGACIGLPSVPSLMSPVCATRFMRRTRPTARSGSDNIRHKLLLRRVVSNKIYTRQDGIDAMICLDRSLRALPYSEISTTRRP
jgi:hypothetical protein